MTSRQDVVNNALKDNGLYDGVGYPGSSNKFDQWLGRPNEYSCSDGITYWFGVMGLHLPLMQSGMQGKQEGTSYCPYFVNYARAHNAVINSSWAQPADVFLFDWNGDGKADHVEMCVGGSGGTRRSIGADSGPSNVDGHRGEGGVHLHDWSVPNNQILVCVDMSKLVTFGASSAPTHADRLLQIVNPWMQGQDVLQVQHFVGVTEPGYGVRTAGAVKDRQHGMKIAEDGIVGPQTWKAFRADPRWK